jgi:SAM-dependent methyltransferase
VTEQDADPAYDGAGPRSGDAPSGAPPPVTRRASDAAESAAASRRWWDSEADSYLDEHGAFLGDARFVWCPEGLSEADAGLLGDVAGRRVLEVGSGAAQCARWLLAQGADPVALDLSLEMLRHGRRIGLGARLDVPLVQADAARLPFGAETFDLACSAYGALPFVADSAEVMREVARVLRPGGRWVFAVTHPVRWSFPDDPGLGGLVARDSYFDRRPYVEQDESGVATYVEHHRTLGDRVRELVGAGFRLVDLVEPEWPGDNTRTWGQWSPLRGQVIPGTAIFVSVKP